MTDKELYEQIKKKRSFLCVGLDPEYEKLPSCITEAAAGDEHFLPLYEFNKKIVEATVPYAVAYKLNLAFYEALGTQGFMQLQKTAEFIKQIYPEAFLIADAKRGDIGNTARQYAKGFFEKMPFDAVTLSPYMGSDSIAPFLEYEGKWAIVLALTSNASAEELEMLNTVRGNAAAATQSAVSGVNDAENPSAAAAVYKEDSVKGAIQQMPLYERVIRTTQQLPHSERIMYVVGATRPSQLGQIRKLAPQSFFLVPGVGAQGGTVSEVALNGMNSSCGLLVNSSRGIIFADSSDNFAQGAADAAERLARQMAAFIK